MTAEAWLFFHFNLLIVGIFPSWQGNLFFEVGYVFVDLILLYVCSVKQNQYSSHK